jgi:hypothetical protein
MRVCEAPKAVILRLSRLPRGRGREESGAFAEALAKPQALTGEGDVALPLPERLRTFNECCQP